MLRHERARIDDRAALCGVIVTFGCVHSGLVRRQRLGREHVERRAGERAVVERGDDVGVDLQRRRAPALIR